MFCTEDKENLYLYLQKQHAGAATRVLNDPFLFCLTSFTISITIYKSVYRPFRTVKSSNQLLTIRAVVVTIYFAISAFCLYLLW